MNIPKHYRRGILQKALPEIHLIKDGGNFTMDVEKFAEELSGLEEK